MDTVIAQKMGGGFNRAQIIDGDNFDVGAAAFDDRAQHVAANAAKSIDGNFYGHKNPLGLKRQNRPMAVLSLTKGFLPKGQPLKRGDQRELTGIYRKAPTKGSAPEGDVIAEFTKFLAKKHNDIAIIDNLIHRKEAKDQDAKNNRKLVRQ